MGGLPRAAAGGPLLKNYCNGYVLDDAYIKGEGTDKDENEGTDEDSG